MELKYKGIVLAKYDTGEADRLYTIYTLEGGKIRVSAPGVRKPAARLAGSLENFNLVDISVVKKTGIGKITSALIENDFAGLKKDFEKTSRAFEKVKYFEKLTGEEIKDRRLFELLKEYLEILDQLSTQEKLKEDILDQGFIFKMLDFSGYKLEVNVCVSCGGKLAGENSFFSASQGGVVCRKCAPKTGELIKTGENSIKLIRLFFANRIGSLYKIRAAKSDIDNLKQISRRFLEWIEK